MDTKKKILIIDDEEDIQKLLKIRLEQDSLTVVTAGDGASGAKMAEQEMPDLILMDIMMPNVDGYSCLKEVRKNQKTNKTHLLNISGIGGKKVLSRDIYALKEAWQKPLRW